MARRSRRHGRAKKTFPILTAAALAIPIAAGVQEHLRGGNGLAEYVKSYLPYNLATKQMDTSGLVQGWAPIGVVLAARMARRFGFTLPTLGPIALR